LPFQHDWTILNETSHINGHELALTRPFDGDDDVEERFLDVQTDGWLTTTRPNLDMS
jgi:hypothetical protein